MMKTAIVTGVTGQDGAYLSAWLLSKGYRVYGIRRPGSLANLWRLDELGIGNHPNFKRVEHDLADLASNIELIEKLEPDEIYHLAAQSSVALSFKNPHDTVLQISIATLNLLEAIRQVKPTIRFFQASSSEMFGRSSKAPQTEDTPFYPCSPYAVGKLNAHWMTVNYRESYSLFASSGILFNHESPLRGLEFVTRKISDSVAKIRLGKLDVLELGNLDAMRDWGFAQEYVEAMWRMLQIEEPDTFVLATRRSESVRDFVRMAFKGAGISVEFKGEGTHETAVVADIQATELTKTALKKGQTVMRVNPDFYRPIDTGLMIGDPAKAKAKLGWEPICTLEQLCKMMVTADLRRNDCEFQTENLNAIPSISI